ncbi:MAG: hypothetical protein IJ960_07595 [Oscillospiraceae bacterium]|nr:hypothetical protein [Oscillospiraceae bacterium]
MKKILFVAVQCTWGFFQTLLGFLVFLTVHDCPRSTYRGAIDTHWNSRSGMSLGLFIFTPGEEVPNAHKVRVHEYGHCVQSLVLGPLYLIVGLISLGWARIPFFVRLRREKKIPYTACFVESWASRWGQWATGEEAIWN